MKTYSYTVNEIEVNSKSKVNEMIRQMTETPMVVKFETFNNEHTSARNIQVKQGRNGYTIS